MKAIHAGVLALMTSVAFVPFASGAETLDCNIGTLAATELGGYYVSTARREVWREDNGVPGLQIRAYGCADGRVIPADQCMAIDPFTGVNQQLLCAAAAGSSSLP